MTPRPQTRRLLAVFALLSVVFASQIQAAFASDTRPRKPGPIGVNDGDQATDPNPADTTQPPTGSGGGRTSSQFSDVPSGFWAGSAINTVAGSHTWMRDYGTKTFRPADMESRDRFAKAVVQAFDPDGKPDPSIKFTDVDPDSPYATYINVAVKNEWMLPIGKNMFGPGRDVTTLMVHRALVWALGLADVVAGANQFHTTDGYTFKHGPTFGTRLIGAVLGLRYNHSDESLDVGPGSHLNRAEVAWSLYRAVVIQTNESWRLQDVQMYKTFHLGPVPAAFRPVVEFGMRFVGFPYVYAGEWNVKSPPGYCCGYQPRGGFDCSGLMWWVLRQGDSLYNAARYHPAYKGYVLNERSSNDMSKAIPAKNRLPWDDVKAGDLLFYDSNHDGTIDHVDLDLGWGWALDSGSYGVTITKVGEPGSWYQNVFTWGRRPVPA